jgi:hypothetical protein
MSEPTPESSQSQATPQTPQPAPTPAPVVATPRPRPQPRTGAPRWLWRLIGWLLTASILGVPYFLMPVEQLHTSGVIWGWGLLVVGIAAALVRTAGGTRVWSAATAAALGLVVVAGSRIAADLAVAPTSHSLWPAELAVAIGAGAVAGLAGALVGAMIAGALKR